MKLIKNSIMLILLILLISTSISCEKTSSDSKGETLSIAYQYGIAYVPLQIMKEQKLIEKYYPSVTVDWQVLNSGSAINEGIASGSIDVGAMGVAPAITGVVKGIPYKIFSALSSQPHEILTNNENINSLSDILPEHKISLVNLGSIQHILLAMAAEKELGDAHALDDRIVAMSHPDGMTALVSGSVDSQLTTSPYIFKALEYENIHSISSISNVWPKGNTFIVGLASEELYLQNPELYKAVTSALADAINYINSNKKEVAALLCESENVDVNTMLAWLENPACGYSADTVGVMQMAAFMESSGFIDKAPTQFSKLAYDNVKGN